MWHAINSAIASSACKESPEQSKSLGGPRVVVKTSNYAATQAASVAAMIRAWFQTHRVVVEEIVDDGSSWNFDISVNGVLLHSRSTQGHGFFHDDWSQQCLVWRAISDLLCDDRAMVDKGA